MDIDTPISHVTRRLLEDLNRPGARLETDSTGSILLVIPDAHSIRLPDGTIDTYSEIRRVTKPAKALARRGLLDPPTAARLFPYGVDRHR